MSKSSDNNQKTDNTNVKYIKFNNFNNRTKNKNNKTINESKNETKNNDIEDSTYVRNGYIRPKTTMTDQLTKEQIQEKLEDYRRVDDIYKVPLGTHLRYFIKDKDGGESKFRMGGQLYNNKGLPKYVILKGVNAQWSVQIADTIFWAKLPQSEIKKEYEEIIDELQQKNNLLKEKNKKLKEENFVLNNEIEVYKEELKKLKKKLK